MFSVVGEVFFLSKPAQTEILSPPRPDVFWLANYRIKFLQRFVQLFAEWELELPPMNASIQARSGFKVLFPV